MGIYFLKHAKAWNFDVDSRAECNRGEAAPIYWVLVRYTPDPRSGDCGYEVRTRWHSAEPVAKLSTFSLDKRFRARVKTDEKEMQTVKGDHRKWPLIVDEVIERVVLSVCVKGLGGDAKACRCVQRLNWLRKLGLHQSTEMLLQQKAVECQLRAAGKPCNLFTLSAHGDEKAIEMLRERFFSQRATQVRLDPAI